MRPFFLSLCFLAMLSPAGYARVWSDTTGRYTIEADLIAFNDRTVVLQRADHELVAVPINELSEADREYLRSEEAGNIAATAAGVQTWTLRDGMKLVGCVVGYGRQPITVQFRDGKIFVNNQLYSSLPEIYQRMVPQIIAQFGNPQVTDSGTFADWLKQQGGQALTFTVDGVILKFETGDQYIVPFFFFSDEDVQVLKPGWDQWFAEYTQYQGQSGQANQASQSEQSFRVQALAAARSRDQQVRRQIAEMQLRMEAVQAGVTALWEVTMYPPAGASGAPAWVVVTGRDSREAIAAALQQNPGYSIGPVRRVSGSSF